MRDFHFLRTPIRGDQQFGLVDVQVGEAPLQGDPRPADVYPQTLEISFEPGTAGPDVQIAPLWEGTLFFLPDSTVGGPADPADVTPAAYPNWPVEGDLILRTNAGSADFDDAFGFHIPLIGRVPATVRYSRVRLTRDFLFTTLDEAAPGSLVFDGKIVGADDPQFHEKVVICFLNGTAGMPCLQDPDDSGRDTALKPMPAVVLAPSGTRTVLRVTVASLSEQVRDPAWFDQRPEYDDLSGELLVEPALKTEEDVLYNPAHPSHSVISAWGLFQGAKLTAYAPDHAIGVPVRAALIAPLPGGLTYRRIDLVRPAIPGKPVGSAPQRPYPQYRLCWAPAGGGPAESLRIPLAGQVYLPLADGSYTLWAIPRSEDPSATPPSDLLTLSVRPPPPPEVVGLPATTVTIDVTGVESTTVYAHLRPYDTLYVWHGYAGVEAVRSRLMAQAEAAWNAKVLRWYILPTNRPESASYAPVYGFIRESAGRHGMAPEFLQTVVFGEGVGDTLTANINAQLDFDPDEVISAFGTLGLDLVLYRTGGKMLDGSAPPIPTNARPDELAEYNFNLVTAGYVDPVTAAAVRWVGEIPRAEAGGTRLIQVASVAGWAAAIELIAAELHVRLDDMEAYLAGKVPPVPVADELQRRFLAYIRFNATFATACDNADHMDTRLKKWVGAQPPNNLNARFNTIQRIAVTQWHEAAGFYR
ncbi:hypothetical protein [Actinomadura sp. 6N118]|uniref:hypothetical protein n=1 Tax=Actinomadura sp. 6N118 TaxID=3375151 RepID=UPI0037BDC77E